MTDLAFSPAAQHVVIVILVWIGFGAVVGLLATVLFPMRRPAGPFWAVVLGIVGTTVGLLGLGWMAPDRPLNPISPVGFLAATIGAVGLLTLYRLGAAVYQKANGKPDEE
ncbi:MAG: GlsB/YeaQ/YmgE family stress response membrane protein [Thermoguttaceae bacterium]